MLHCFHGEGFYFSGDLFSFNVGIRMWLWVAVLFAPVVYSSLPPLIYSVNCGGEDVVDALGIHFSADQSNDGIASDFGKRHEFRTVFPVDRLLYQSERYALHSFSYTIELPTEVDDEYTIDFRFAEVYFDRPGAKVFNVLINGQPIISHLDILKEAQGRGRPYDVHKSFKVQDGNLVFGNVILDFDGVLEITFAKGEADNAKCNAFAVFRGPARDLPYPPRIPEAPPTQTPIIDEEEFAAPETTDDESSSAKYGSGPPVSDPFADQDMYESILPFLVVIPCLIPVVYLLYRMK